tara:strand:+ start:23 stop:304 length:282 start_codon:yes stop_codon:yes gene_type:complete
MWESVIAIHTQTIKLELMAGKIETNRFDRVVERCHRSSLYCDFLNFETAFTDQELRKFMFVTANDMRAGDIFFCQVKAMNQVFFFEEFENPVN